MPSPLILSVEEFSVMVVSLIICMDPSGLVGNGDKLPWDVSEDMQWFIKNTRHKAIVMGRKTFQGIGRALPGRLNIMLTNSGKSGIEGVEDFNDLRAAIRSANARGYTEVVIAGGPELYRYALDLNLVDKIYLTTLKQRYEGDTYFKHETLMTLSDRLGSGDFTMVSGWTLESERTTSLARYRVFTRVRFPGSKLVLDSSAKRHY